MERSNAHLIAAWKLWKAKTKKMKEYWIIEKKTTIEESDGRERLVEGWWRNTEKFKTLEDALNAYIYDDCEYDDKIDNYKFEQTVDEEGRITLKGRTIVSSSGLRATKSEVEKWNKEKESFKGVALCVYARFFYINEDNMSVEDLKTMASRFTCL